jgi:hypothetical protein
MANPATYSIVITPGQREVCLTLLESIYVPHQGLIPRTLHSVWTPWEGAVSAGRRLFTEGLQRASDEMPPVLPLENDTPKASAPPGGPRGVLSVPTARIKNARRRR